MSTISTISASRDAGCPSVADAEDWLAVDANNQATTRGQFVGALVATALGLPALVLGLGSLARRHPRTEARWDLSFPLSAVREAGETLLVAICCLVVVIFLERVAVQVVAGWPLAWDTLDRAFSALLDVFSVVAAG